MKSVFNQMAFGIYGTYGTGKMPQMPIVPSAKQNLRK
jgi:hypothetical protein